jgi:phosphoribosylaminoimidazolecarboxamide formyltransferase / IMP cyclohydrolase
VAPGYEPAALAILSAKKKGGFIVLQATEGYVPPAAEYREVYGMTFEQKRNDRPFTAADVADVRTGDKAKGSLSDAAQRDLILSSIALKYTQSNSVAFAKDGQCIGIGAGQQSRVDCVKLASRKVATWALRQHPKVRALKFKPAADGGPKRQDRVNARVRYIEGDFTAEERTRWEALFAEVPEPLTAAEKDAHMAALDGVALSSDAFFPFRDSIDHASKVGVQYVAQPGGSVMDDSIVACCEEYGMQMAFTNFRLFHH